MSTTEPARIRLEHPSKQIFRVVFFVVVACIMFALSWLKWDQIEITEKSIKQDLAINEEIRKLRVRSAWIEKHIEAHGEWLELTRQAREDWQDTEKSWRGIVEGLKEADRVEAPARADAGG